MIKTQTKEKLHAPSRTRLPRNGNKHADKKTVREVFEQVIGKANSLPSDISEKNIERFLPKARREE